MAPIIPLAQPRDIATARRAAMLKRLLGDLIGGLVVQDGLTDVEANSDGTVWATFLGRSKVRVGTIASDDAEKLIYAVAKVAGESVGRDRPTLAAELEIKTADGPVALRFQGFLPPVTRAASFIIRNPPAVVFTLDDYVAQGVMAPAQRARLALAVELRENVLVAGGTGTGKTTVMNALLHCTAHVTPDDRVIGVERTRELRCSSPNAEFLRVGDGYSAQQALQDALRANPDRIMVGEVRGAEALDMLMAWNTGHDGGFCTIHAKTSAPTPRAALLRLEQAGSLATAQPLQRMIAETVDLVVCIRKSAANPAGRVLSHIAAVHGWTGTDYDIQMEPHP